MDALVLPLGSYVTLAMLIVALGIFAWLTARSRKIRGFQFQISIFVVIWILAEIVNLLEQGGAIQPLIPGGASSYIHVTAMAAFTFMLWIRFYLSRKSGKQIADSFQEV